MLHDDLQSNTLTGSVGGGVDGSTCSEIENGCLDGSIDMFITFNMCMCKGFIPHPTPRGSQILT